MSGWPPDSLEGVRVAAAQGLLRERHTVEAKRALGNGHAANVEFARDLASFAIDGGDVFVGVDERGTEMRVEPIAVAGLRERIEQIALSVPSPPLHVTTRELVDNAGHDRGVIVVTVPPSPLAPHQVDGRYWARNDATKFALDDAQIRRLFERQATRLDEIDGDLKALRARMPSRSIIAERSGELAVVARPTTGQPDMLLSVVGPARADWSSLLVKKIQLGLPGQVGGAYSPDLGYPHGLRRLADGWALHTDGITEAGWISSTVRRDLQLEIGLTEDGRIELACYGAARQGGQNNADRLLIIDTLLLGLTKTVVVAASVVASEAQYRGNWDFAVGVDGIAGGFSSWMYQNFDRSPSPYPEDSYRGRTSATQAEIKADPAEIVRRLLGRLNRALNHDEVDVP